MIGSCKVKETNQCTAVENESMAMHERGWASGYIIHCLPPHRHSRWVCVMLGEIPSWRCAQRDWLLPLRDFQSCLSTLSDSFLFRKRLCSSHPPFLPTRDLWGKDSGQRIWAAGDKRAHAGSMSVCLSITAERAFAFPLCPARFKVQGFFIRHILNYTEYNQ